MSSLPLKDLVDQWLHLDPNPETRDEIQALWDREDYEELEKRMRIRIEFGTAGLRGRMEAGWSRMNDLIIIQTSQGLAEYVLQHVQNAKSRGLVIGHDHRHNSEHWANLTTQTFIAKGIKVYSLRGLNHTPMVPFSVKKLQAACGVMITASHNPKQDNGYKVYWENAVQIIGPHDEGISKSIHSNLQPDPLVNVNAITPFLIDLTEELRQDYFDCLRELSSSHGLNPHVPVKFVNTSMHGVGDPFSRKAFAVFGFSPYIPVKEQQEADPEFPTVKFPNPEEKGALNFAIETANRVEADYILAQDPDADRFTAAEKGANGEWTLFTGDQLGSLFAYQVFKAYKSSGKPVDKLAMVASTVSSKMIESMARVEGFKFTECLTGFKFIGNTALNLVEQGYDVPFGYEEAIGFMFGTYIRDKDGVAATVSFAELVASLRAEGKTVKEHLQELYQRYGYFETSNSYFISNNPKITDEVFAHIRHQDPENNEANYPKTLGSLGITRIIDLTTGYDSGNPPKYQPSLPLSSGHIIQIRAGDAAHGVSLVLTLRTSGTEPKIKYYLEGKGENSQLVRPLLSKAVEDIANNWIQCAKYNLRMA